MALGFGVGDFASPEVNGSLVALHRTESLAAWAGLLGPQQGRFLLQEFLDGSLGHGTGRGRGHLLDVVGVEVQVRADLLVDPSRDDFPPPLGHLLRPRCDPSTVTYGKA